MKVLLDTAVEKNTAMCLKAALEEARTAGLTDEDLEAATAALAKRTYAIEGMGDKYTGLDSIKEALRGTSTALVKGSWLIGHSESGDALPRRQNLPSGALWSAEDLLPRLSDWPSWEEDHLGKNLPASVVAIIAVSYCWVSPEHPDPHGEQEAVLARVTSARLQHREQNPVDDTATFFDWASLFQNPRSEEEQAAFKAGLQAVNLWYGHLLVEKWLLTALPKGAPADMKKYEDRGWPTFERQICSLISKFSKLLDLGQVTEAHVSYAEIAKACAVRKRPLPSLPSEFAARLAKTTFTNKADHQFVEKKYAQTLEEIMGTAEALDFGFRGWNGAQAAELARDILPLCPKLREFKIGSNPIGDTRAVAVVAAMPAELEVLALYTCGLSDAGLRAVLAGLKRCASLCWLEIRGNPVSDAGAEALALALPEMPKLENLDARRTEISEQGKQRLAQAWVEAGKDPRKLQL